MAECPFCHSPIRSQATHEFQICQAIQDARVVGVAPQPLGDGLYAHDEDEGS